MSKLCLGETNEHPETVSGHRNKTDIHNNEHTTVCIGTSNVKRWTELKVAYQYSCDVKFTSFLLNLAQKHRKKRNNENKKKYKSPGEPSKDEPTRRSSRQRQTENAHKHKKSQDNKSHRKKLANKEETKNCDKKVEKSKRKSGDLEEPSTEISEEKLVISSDKDELEENVKLIEKIEDNLPIIDKIKDLQEREDISEVEDKIDEVNKEEETYVILTENTENNIVNETIEKKSKHKKKHKPHLKTDEPEINQIILECETTKSKLKLDKSKRKVKHHDIRKAPQLDLNQIKSESTIETPITQIPPQSDELIDEIKTERVAIKIKLCITCNTRHLQESCPLRNPVVIIQDFVDFDSWKENSRNENDKSNDSSSDEQYPTFAETSLPSVLYLEQSDSSHGLSVFAKCDIKEFTKFGPLVGNIVKEVDISEDSSMQHVWEIHLENNNIYINTEDTNSSNWIRYMRPAPTRELKNMLALSYSQQIYLVTTRDINGGEELLYWQDDAAGSTKKKMEKTNCGGCNLTFTHPLYYRIHCSVFHDVRYSLTIRKYHCKICGAAVLGKDNIMKHAVELHNGQGAYQCQFCKKFFLRLNYLEMHRTYGCAANPHRSRPLCDFCGRKFCQPQKLKVHIKRMHSDMAEVLREFQCKNCLKLLGSRAALQRHVKEVHQKQMDGSCTCVRCGKLFQNKSNLKIHMLTHSGIKPFKCKESNCNAAFTTKQCLQFHYKKVHGFAEEIMPKIERSVEYTFAAYAGVKDGENSNGRNKRRRLRPSIEESNLMSMDESTDIDDISLDDKNLDEPPVLHSPIPTENDPDEEDSSRCSNQTPPMLEDYSLKCTKMQSKGSKKWLGEDLPLPQQIKDVYQFEKEIEKPSEQSLLDVDESQQFDRSKINVNLNVYNRHESSNASLLVEAALDSVSDIQMSNSEHNVDVVNSSCNELNNLYLSHQDNLPDVTYNHSEDLNESRDINLISPSVNDHISVTDHDLNDDPNRGISLDYSTLHHNDFSPSNSPNHNRSGQLLHDYNIHVPSPAHTPRSRLDYTLGHDSEIVSPGTSPPRYDFHHTPVENLSSDESNGIVAQNLSLNNSKDKLRLDLSYKSHYGEIDSVELRKYDLRHLESERNKLYDLEINDRNKNYIDTDVRSKFLTSTELESDLRKSYDNLDHSDMKLKQFEIETEFRNKYDQMDSKYEGNKLDMDIELRSKTYDGLDSERNKTYETSLETEIRNKSYDVIDELRTKTYDLDAEFRSDRNFEPLVLNPTELQGLDMSARSYHNFHPTGQGLNRYHHLYSELDRPSVDLRLGYSPPPPTYSDVLRVVSLDLTPPGRHSVDLSLRSHALHSHQLPNRLLSDHPLQTNRLIATDHNLTTNRILSEHNRLALDQTRLEHNLNNRLLTSETGNRLLTSDLNNRLLGAETRLIPDTSNRLLSDHTTNRLLSNDQLSTNRLLSTEQGRLLPSEPGRLLSTEQSRLLGDEASRLLTDQSRLLDQTRLIGDTRILQPTPTTSHEIVARTSLSPVGYSGYPVSPSPYHASSLAARSHGNSPGHTASYHHYSAYY